MKYCLCKFSYVADYECDTATVPCPNSERRPKVAILKESTPSTEQESQEEKFLLHLVDVVACFATEQNMFYATKTRKELIQKARETFKPESHERTTI